MSQEVYTGKERRNSVRFRFDANVTIEYNGQNFEATGIDFNDDSIGITNQQALPVGAHVKITLIDEVGNEVVLHGEVARSSPSADAEGMANMVIKQKDG